VHGHRPHRGLAHIDGVRKDPTALLAADVKPSLDPVDSRSGHRVVEALTASLGDHLPALEQAKAMLDSVLMVHRSGFLKVEPFVPGSGGDRNRAGGR
jgi:hypothetical protein